MIKIGEAMTYMKAKIRNRVNIPLKDTFGEFVSFSGLMDRKENVAIIIGQLKSKTNVLVRVHSECLTGDVFGSGRCDCGEQLNEAINEMTATGGILLYLRQEGRGIGLYEKLDAYSLQEKGIDTYSANVMLGHKEDQRDYTVAVQMLEALGVESIVLMTNNPDKKNQLEKLGIHIVGTRPTKVFLKSSNVDYLKAKVLKTGHTIALDATDLISP